MREPTTNLGAVDTYAVSEEGQISRKPSNQPMGPTRSQLFTWTTKVHAPSWSLPAVGTCPAVCKPYVKELESGSPDALERAVAAIPEKCRGCYAFASGKYGTDSVRRAQHRRWSWFDSTPDAEVVDALVSAIQVGGKDTCRIGKVTSETPWRGGTRRDRVDCSHSASAMPSHLRLFDSGDFHNARAVRIWTQVARRLPHGKFWAPTTAWSSQDHPEIRKALEHLAALPNVAVKPSALSLDEPPPTLPIGTGKAAGTTVLSWKRVKRLTNNCPWTRRSLRRTQACERKLREITNATDGSGNPIRYDPDDDTTLPRTAYIDGVKHAICRGDCAKCQLCWNKGTRIAYLRHGPKVEAGKISAARQRALHRYVTSRFPQFEDRGPWRQS